MSISFLVITANAYICVLVSLRQDRFIGLNYEEAHRVLISVHFTLKIAVINQHIAPTDAPASFFHTFQERIARGHAAQQVFPSVLLQFDYKTPTSDLAK